MRWMVVAFVGVALWACGGESHRTGLNSADGGTGGSGGSGPSGPYVRGSSGAPAGVGVAPYPSDPVTQDDSAECRNYKNESDVTAACSLADVNGCEFARDLTTFLSGPTSTRFPDIWYARIGCGVTEFAQKAGYGTTLAYDADGKLIGYSMLGDVQWGPCKRSYYQRGSYLGDCSEIRECEVAEAPKASSICRCACPNPPPPDGVATVETACVDRPSRGWTCADMFEKLGTLDENYGMSGRVVTGCGAVGVELSDQRGALRCVYDQTALTLVGVGYVPSGFSGCDGVTEWQSGTPFPRNCSNERTCVFGAAVGGGDASTPCGADIPR